MRYVCLFMVSLGCALAQQYKAGEYELYAEVTKQYAAGDFGKALAALEAWTGKVPETEFANNRRILYVQTYFALKQPGKVMEVAAPLLEGDAGKVFPAAADRLRVLYLLVTAIRQVGEPTAGQQATAKLAARQLAEMREAPQGMAAADWERARNDLGAAAQSALLYLALLPVAQAMKGNDCAGAEAAVRKALEEHPMSVQAAWYQGSALLCLARQKAGRTSEAIYAFARAAALDPVKGMVDAKWQQSTVAPYLEKLYTQYHGKDAEGLEQLKAQAVGSVLPPAGFHIASAAELAQQKQADFESRNPELALWKRIQEALVASNGEQYFASELKDSELPPLRGTLVGATPACGATELRVAVDGGEAQIALKLEKAVRGKLEAGGSIRWQGVATGFQKAPFLLTMETEGSKVDGLQVSPCGPARQTR
ncbi:MAG: hypothetical protein JNK48_25080 [Bryobacterales bacterium]|nr:hypothetical protein [Bryobacterales bacterium]